MEAIKSRGEISLWKGWEVRESDGRDIRKVRASRVGEVGEGR